MLAAKVIHVHPEVNPKADDVFTAERLEEHKKQRSFLKNTGHAQLVDIHGTTITFDVENHQKADRKVLRVKDDLGNTATEEVGPDDVFVTWFNTRMIMSQKYPNYGDRCEYQEMAKIQRYCPFEMGVWKNVPLGAGKNIFKKWKESEKKSESEDVKWEQKKIGDDKASKEAAAMGLDEKKWRKFRSENPKAAKAQRKAHKKFLKAMNSGEMPEVQDEKKAQEVWVTEKAVSLTDSVTPEASSFFARTREFVKSLFGRS